NGIPPPDIDLPFVNETRCVPTRASRPLALSPLPLTLPADQIYLSHVSLTTPGHRITPEEWMTAIEFLTRTGQTSAPHREFALISNVLGASALVDALNNPRVSTETESSNLGPFFTEDAPEVSLGESIASEGKGEYMYVQGQVRDTSGAPIPGAVIDTWETDDKGFYDLEYPGGVVRDCRGRLVADEDGKYEYRAVVPIYYPMLTANHPVGDLLLALGRHNVRPSHLHMMIRAPGFRKLTTALYPEGDVYLASDPVFGVKKSLVVKLVEIDDEAEARKRGFPKGSKFKLLSYDFTLLSDAEYTAARAELTK
ncbi:Intradiol ring-cleavage dioxygenase, partial [Lactarius tabidus]